MGAVVFTSRLSRWIAGMYWAILVFMGSLLLGIPLAADMGTFEGTLFYAVFVIVMLVLLFILYKAYRMRFTVTKEHILIGGLFKKHIITLKNITSVEKTPIPSGFRLFGASYLGGWHYFPGIGKTWVAMGNFQDGVMITTKQGNRYLITPKKPLEFIKLVKKSMK